MTKKQALTDARLEAICMGAARRVCASYHSPLLTEEVFEETLVTAHLCRAEGIGEPLLCLKVKHRAVDALRSIIGCYRPPGESEYRAGYKLACILTDGLTATDAGGSQYDNPKLPRQECQYEQVDRREFAASLLAKLDERRRGIVMARYYDGLSDVEIGRRYGVGGGVIAKTVAYSLRTLRALPEMQDAYW